MLEETYTKRINGQFFVVYRDHASRKKNPYRYKLDGDFIKHVDWKTALEAAVAAEMRA